MTPEEAGPLLGDVPMPESWLFRNLSGEPGGLSVPLHWQTHKEATAFLYVGDRKAVARL